MLSPLGFPDKRGCPNQTTERAEVRRGMRLFRTELWTGEDCLNANTCFADVAAQNMNKEILRSFGRLDLLKALACLEGRFHCFQLRLTGSHGLAISMLGYLEIGFWAPACLKWVGLPMPTPLLSLRQAACLADSVANPKLEFVSHATTSIPLYFPGLMRGSTLGGAMAIQRPFPHTAQ